MIEAKHDVKPTPRMLQVEVQTKHFLLDPLAALFCTALSEWWCRQRLQIIQYSSIICRYCSACIDGIVLLPAGTVCVLSRVQQLTKQTDSAIERLIDIMRLVPLCNVAP